MRHGEMPAPGFPTEDDPPLANVWADMHTFLLWEEANCDCDALCLCDDPRQDLPDDPRAADGDWEWGEVEDE